MSEHNESLKEVIFEVENICRKDPRLNKFHKAEKAHVQYFFGTKSPKYPRAPPHISTLYVHPLYLNHDLSNFVGSEINFDTWFIVAVYLAIKYISLQEKRFDDDIWWREK